MGHFGHNFREAREKRELTLDQVSNVTKISPRMLKAIEEEHFDQLPGGVFNKGFIRAYARHVGIDEEEAVTGYLAALREGQINEQRFMPEFRAVYEDHAVVAAPQPPAAAKLPDLKEQPKPTQPKP